MPRRAAARSAVLNPAGFLTGAAAAAALADGAAANLAGGQVAFSTVEEIGTAATPAFRLIGLAEASRRFSRRMALLSGERMPFAGVEIDRPRIVAAVNATPDSFSGGDGDPPRAIDRAHELVEAGADIVDIGGESTRPGAEPVSVSQELRRVLPVIEAVRGAPVSVDTRRAEVMRQALAAGAAIVNDVSALTGDPESLETVAASRASVILMHMQGDPRTMQLAPTYRLASFDIFRWLERRVAACLAAGIERDRIAVDPGIGFGKSDDHNVELLDRAGSFHGLGCAVMIGASRKSFIGRIADAANPRDRVPGTVMATAIALSRGVQLHRVHDVGEIRQAVAIWQAMTAEADML